MKYFLTSAIFATSTLFGATAAVADGHATKQLVVPGGLCPGFVQKMAGWAKYRAEYTAFAVPNADRSGRCGDDGPRITVGIGTAPKASDARSAALATCNANRGNYGACRVVGVLRDKK